MWLFAILMSGEVSVQIFYLLWNCGFFVVILLLLTCVFKIFWLQNLYLIHKFMILSQSAFLHFLKSIFQRTKTLIVMKFNFSLCSVLQVMIFFLLRNLYLPQGMKDILLLLSKNFIVFSFSFRSMIHFESIFLYGMR